MKQQVKDFQHQSRRQQENSADNTASQQASQSTSKEKVGEYIDFEEIKK